MERTVARKRTFASSPKSSVTGLTTGEGPGLWLAILEDLCRRLRERSAFGSGRIQVSRAGMTVLASKLKNAGSLRIDLDIDGIFSIGWIPSSRKLLPGCRRALFQSSSIASGNASIGRSQKSKSSCKSMIVSQDNSLRDKPQLYSRELGSAPRLLYPTRIR